MNYFNVFAMNLADLQVAKTVSSSISFLERKMKDKIKRMTYENINLSRICSLCVCAVKFNYRALKAARYDV
jgi:hypothetical protein